MRYLLIISLLVLGACQTPAIKAYEQLQVGMEKDQILDIMGNPAYTDRRKGQDRWTYIFYDNNQKLEKKVYFTEGKSTYIGDPIPLPIEEQAQTVDEKNETGQEAYIRFEKEVREKQAEKLEEEKKVQYLPAFEEIR